MIGNIMLSPFGSVKFGDFFLADIITSAVLPLQDMGYVFDGIL